MFDQNLAKTIIALKLPKFIMPPYVLQEIEVDKYENMSHK